MIPKKNVPEQGMTQSRVEAAMRRLRTKFPSDLGEAYIPALAEKYEYMVGPERSTPSKAATKRQLSNVAKHGTALLVSMASLQGPAIDSLNFCCPTLGELERILQRLVDAAAPAAVRTVANDRKGRKLKSKPREIAGLPQMISTA
jgi:hypothetical protein